jgi:hypothetical protein
LFKQEDEYDVQREGRRVGGGWEEILKLNEKQKQKRIEKDYEHKFR